MYRFFAGFLVCAALYAIAVAQDGVAQAPQATAVAPNSATDIAAAEANRTLMVRRPEWISGPDPDFPDSEKALGHNGDIIVRGLLGTDGHLRYASIETSSRAPALDASALAAATAASYRPAEDANHQPIAVMLSAPMKFYAYRSREGVGAARYTCGQFVLDMDWWRSAFPERRMQDHEFYTMIFGLSVISRMHQGAERAFSAESTAAFTRRWLASIETCRNHADWRFAQAIHPEGDIIDRLAARQAPGAH